MIPVFSPHRYHIGPDLGHGKAHESERIGNDPGACARCDLEKGMTKPFDLNCAEAAAGLNEYPPLTTFGFRQAASAAMEGERCRIQGVREPMNIFHLDLPIDFPDTPIS
jgi:hypothetical protein